jgi:uridine phosphorylase
MPRSPDRRTSCTRMQDRTDFKSFRAAASGRLAWFRGTGGASVESAFMPSASYPNFAGKHAEGAIFTPADFAAYLRRVGALEAYEPPAGVVLCYQRSLYKHVLQLEGLNPAERRGALHGILPLPSTAGRVGLLGQFGIGAPAAAAALEDLAATGTSAFVSLGTAGSLQRDLNVGDLVLCEAAIRDEGVSHHYLPPAKLATATAAMSGALRAAMRQAGVAFRAGTSWTIDTPYRETVAEARHYQGEGVLCVEMEAAALFAVAEVRGLNVASAFVISDSLADLVWNPQFHRPEVEAGLITLYQATLSALRQTPAKTPGCREPGAAGPAPDLHPG